MRNPYIENTMRQTIQIQEIETKKTNNGASYIRVRTDKGWMTAWDYKMLSQFQDGINNMLDVEIVQKGNFTNIQKIYGELGDAPVEVVKPGETRTVQKPTNGTSMYVSYAKDVYLGMVNTGNKDLTSDITGAVRTAKEWDVSEHKMVMNAAIEIVKLAKEAFE